MIKSHLDCGALMQGNKDAAISIHKGTHPTSTLDAGLSYLKNSSCITQFSIRRHCSIWLLCERNMETQNVVLKQNWESGNRFNIAALRLFTSSTTSMPNFLHTICALPLFQYPSGQATIAFPGTRAHNPSSNKLIGACVAG
ncbi:predicted protein [Aspergillus nidulans FGSC A4]|uniref:Uncharacterized protein n=1 Tax=Emericella nidulans (strain FGSC A4 / ATCC 38163 / CBS 112.46 / NRRL 194 / M139) TaxID=227321 RepID=Q5AUR5_EMENI|nr:hypothetical protein [Aspergillus nidulans FGSC A4]EAA59619.1 predicted protein [Aspergillus nidulans FGSC A4]CBF73611.1 TPA: conserved hypothetical protein [Aspergillus nidulans FGSC A4]|eukprot:XP_681234.1 predicted protein [Aspergillus nidulans FGSC A4]